MGLASTSPVRADPWLLLVASWLLLAASWLLLVASWFLLVASWFLLVASWLLMASSWLVLLVSWQVLLVSWPGRGSWPCLGPIGPQGPTTPQDQEGAGAAWPLLGGHARCTGARLSRAPGGSDLDLTCRALITLWRRGEGQHYRLTTSRQNS